MYNEPLKMSLYLIENRDSILKTKPINVVQAAIHEAHKYT